MSWNYQPQDPDELPDNPAAIPRRLTQTRRYGDRLLVAGHGPRPASIMVLGDQVLDEDARETLQVVVGSGEIKCRPQHGKGPSGHIVKDTALAVGLDLGREAYWTTVLKWLPPRGVKVSKDMITESMPTLEWEIEQQKPKVIIAAGKLAFDAITDLKLAKRDIEGGWFESRKFGADDDTFSSKVYPIQSMWNYSKRPERIDGLRVDLRDIKIMHDEISGISYPRVDLHYRTLATTQQVADWVEERLREPAYRIFSVDCEWGGLTFVDGKLRSIQLCWRPGHAVYIRFMDDKGNYAMDRSYREIGQILARLLDRDDVWYVGHQISADLPWMHHWLGLKWYDKCLVDTAFARQVVDEYAAQGLERLSLTYTDLGRYDVELMMWRKTHPTPEESGYALIPDEILIPYACLRGDSLVQLGDGSWCNIRTLVSQRYTGEVKALVGGKVVSRRVTNWFRADVGQREWFRIKTASTRSGRWGVMGPVFTPDHEVLTQRGKVRIDQLQPGKDRIITDEPEFGPDQLRVVLGSLLGDGGVPRRNNSKAGFSFSQQYPRGAYAKWKAEILSSALAISVTENPDGSVVCRSDYCRKMVGLVEMFPRQDGSVNYARKLVITEALLDRLGPLGLAVWYQDDGVFTKDLECRIICSKLTEDEIAAVERWFGRFGSVIYDRNQGAIRLRVASSSVFLEHIAPWIHPACAYKANRPVGGNLAQVSSACGGLFTERILSVEPTPNRREKGHGVRFCLAVEEAENFLTEVGFVSNCKDVDVVMRAYPQLMSAMLRDDTLEYYRTIFNPFVTNVFTEFVIHGLPIDRFRMEDLRQLCDFSVKFLEAKLRQHIVREARELLRERLTAFDQMSGPEVFEAVERLCAAGANEQAREVLKSFLDIRYVEFHDLYQHYLTAPTFNLRSPDHMPRWLYGVKGYMPLKSTSKKEQGMPSIAWSKVLEKPADQRHLYKPSCDKQSLQILSEQYDDDGLKLLLQLNAIGNLLKAFLKVPTLNDEGELVRENGLFFFIASDGRIHGQYSTTETGRPRAWKPNSLNWPSMVVESMSRTIGAVLVEADQLGILPEELRGYLPETADELPYIPSIRSCVVADEGWIFVESDLQTAEIRGLAFASGDPTLIRLMTETDPEFGYIDSPNREVVRLFYAPDSPALPQYQNPDFIMAEVKAGKVLRRFTHAQLLRGADGRIVSPPYDLHWSLAEMVHGKPRESLHKKDRLAAKKGNFGWSYDIQASTLERQIEAEIGSKPEPGIGERIIEALDRRQPVALAYLERVAEIPDNPGHMQLASGRKRHFVRHPDNIWGIRARDRESLMNNQGREARNCPMQESVAATVSRASNWLISSYRQLDLPARLPMVLYDSVLTHCRMEYRFAVAQFHQQLITDRNTWLYNGRTMNYPIDTEFNLRWSERPSKEQLSRFNDPSWNVHPDILQRTTEFLNNHKPQAHVMVRKNQNS